MAEPKITVSLTHDQWQWVMSLVLNSAYVRARPIVEAVEAAVKQHGIEASVEAARERSAHEELLKELYDAQFQIRQQSHELTRLERQVTGYKGQIAKQKKAAKQANGEDDPAPLAVAEAEVTKADG